MVDYITTYEDMLEECSEEKEADGFCRICCSCSGPARSNLAFDYEEELPEGVVVYRGGNHGNCKFLVKEEF